MKKKKNSSEDKGIIKALEKLTERIEEATVDINHIKFDLKAVKLDLKGIEHVTSITKVDVEKLREEMKKMSINIDDTIENTAEILLKMVGQEEFQQLSKRVASLEQQ